MFISLSWQYHRNVLVLVLLVKLIFINLYVHNDTIEKIMTPALTKNFPWMIVTNLTRCGYHHKKGIENIWMICKLFNIIHDMQIIYDYSWYANYLVWFGQIYPQLCCLWSLLWSDQRQGGHGREIWKCEAWKLETLNLREI